MQRKLDSKNMSNNKNRISLDRFPSVLVRLLGISACILILYMLFVPGKLHHSDLEKKVIKQEEAILLIEENIKNTMPTNHYQYIWPQGETLNKHFEQPSETELLLFKIYKEYLYIYNSFMDLNTINPPIQEQMIKQRFSNKYKIPREQLDDILFRLNIYEDRKKLSAN